MKHLFLALGFLLTLFLLPTPPAVAWPGAPASDAQITATTLHFDQAVRSVAVQGTYAFVAVGKRLIMLDVSEPIAPVVRWQSADITGVSLTEVVISESFVYASDDNNLAILDASNPLYLRPISVTEWPARYDLAIHGHYAYFAEPAGLRIVDMADPTAPAQVAWQGRLGKLSSVDVGEDPAGSGQIYTYVAGGPREELPGEPVGGGFRILDVTDPALPQEVYPCNNDSPCDRWGETDVAVMNGKAYVAYKASIDANFRPRGLRVYDVTDPRHPIVLGLYETSDFVRQVTIVGTIAYATTDVGLHMLDVSDPSQPRALAFYTLSTPYYVWGDVAADENCAYVAEGERGLTILCRTSVTPTPPATVFLPMVITKAI